MKRRGNWAGRVWLAGTVAVLAAGVAAGHDTWAVPEKFRVKAGEKVKVRLATSEAFPTSEAAAGLERVARFVARSAEGESGVTGYRAEGEFLVGEVKAGAGITVVQVELKPRAFVLEPQIFNEYLNEEKLGAILAARAQAGMGDSAGRERYRKIAKAVVCTEGSTDGSAQAGKPFGAWLEIVAETDLCAVKVGDEVKVQVLFQGKPIRGVQVTAGYEGVKGHGYPIWVETDAEGRAAMRVDRAGAWFLRTLHMVKSDAGEADWDSAFSTVTFFVRPKAE
jgi:uncharacterized GH25 family protein